MSDTTQYLVIHNLQATRYDSYDLDYLIDWYFDFEPERLGQGEDDFVEWLDSLVVGYVTPFKHGSIIVKVINLS